MGQQRDPPFPVTDWHALQHAANSASFHSAKAKADLLASYLPAIRGYLVGICRLPSHVADDLLQGFVAEKVLKGRMFGKADRARGRFRNLVLKSLNNYVATHFSKQARDPLKDSGQADLPEQAVGPVQTRGFDLEWACQVVRASAAAIKIECEAKNRPDLWGVFHGRFAGPALEEQPEVSYDEIVRRFECSSPREIINLLTTAKRMFYICLRAEVALYVGGEQQVDEELADLRAILFGTRPI